MTYVVTDNCIACKYTDCVEVCPSVAALYEGENMLVIHRMSASTAACASRECPADAIRPDTEPDMEKWVEFNRKYSLAWPVIVTRKDPLPEAEARDWRDGQADQVLFRGTGHGRLTLTDDSQIPAAGSGVRKPALCDMTQGNLAQRRPAPWLESRRFHAIYPLQTENGA